MATTEKARMIALRLADILKKKSSLGALAFAEGMGTSGDPTINIGPGTTRGANAFIRVVPKSMPLQKDILGNASPTFTPHTIQLATEANYAGVTDNIADNLTRQRLIDIVGPVIGMGCTVEWYEEADGTAPIETTIAAGKLKATFFQDDYNTLAGQ